MTELPGNYVTVDRSRLGYVESLVDVHRAPPRNPRRYRPLGGSRDRSAYLHITPQPRRCQQRPSWIHHLQAYQLLAQGFGPGFNGPLLLVAQLPNPGDEAAFVSIARDVAAVPGVVSVASVVANPAGRVAIATVYPSTSPQAAQTTLLVDHLRSDVIPKAEAGSGLSVLVGGQTAIQTDFAHVL